MIDLSFLYKKLVDKSTLFQGFSIPVKYQPLFLQLCEGMLVHGESMMVKILIDGELFDAEWKNQATISMNNDTDNIIILSPSFHRIIHKAKPVFDYENLSFVFPNGVVEKVKLNKHLGIF